MSDNSETEEPDFNIVNWKIKDLIELFNISSSIKKTEISDYINEKKDEILEKVPENDKEEYEIFLDEAVNKVENNKDLIIEQFNELSKITKGLKNVDSNINLAGSERATQLLEDANVSKTYSKIEVVEGDRNPILQNTYTTWLNIDSEYRDITKSTSSSVPLLKINCRQPIQKEIETVEQKHSSTDFTFTLDSVLKDVIEMCLVNIEIDLKGYYTFSNTYGNLSFEIDNGETHEIKIDEGNYTNQELENKINSLLINDIAGIKAVINNINRKTYFYGEPIKNPWLIQNTIQPLPSGISSENLNDIIIDENDFIYAICDKDGSNNSIYFLDLNFKERGWIEMHSKSNYNRKNFKCVIDSAGLLYIIGGIDNNNNNNNNKYSNIVESINLNNLDNWWIKNSINYINYVTEEKVSINSARGQIVQNILENNKKWNEESIRLNTRRSDFALVKDANDTLFILGGKSYYDYEEQLLDTVETLDFKNKALGFKLKSYKLNEEKCCLGAIIVNNKIYAVGGKKKTTQIEKTDTVETLDITNGYDNSWNKTESTLNTARSNFGISTNFKNKIYVFGGEVMSNEKTNEMETLDLDNGDNSPWSIDNNNIDASRSHFGYIRDSNEDFYIIGGDVSGNSSPPIEKYKSKTDIIWYQNKKDEYCNTQNKGKKINSSLGWTLGYRELKSSLLNTKNQDKLSYLQNLNQKYGTVGTAVYNLFGTPYLMLEVDDFNKNRYTGEIGRMSMPAEIEKFKTPEYAKKIESSYSVCKTDKNNLVFTETTFKDKNIMINRPNRMGTQPIAQGVVGRDTLTSAQKYTMLQIKNHQSKMNINQYYSPYSDNILYRFPVEKPSDINERMVITNIAGMEYGRKFFGPVNIEKLRIRLLDNKGYPIELNGGEISLSLIFTRLYQY